MAYTGTVVSWISRKGYGFVSCKDFDDDLFIHVSGFGGGELIEGRTVSFDVENDSKGGKMCCVNVTGDAIETQRREIERRRESRERPRDRRRDSRDRYDSRDRRGGDRDRRRRDSRDRYDSRDRRGGDRDRRGDRYDSRDRRGGDRDRRGDRYDSRDRRDRR